MLKLHHYLLVTYFLSYAYCVFTTDPVWVTSPYIKAGSNKVISTLTGNSSTPQATIPFPGTPFTSIPNVGYGSTSYIGNDALGSEMFQINMTSVNETSFSVLIQISGFTHIHILEVRFLAVDRLFPHSLNSYDNVPINYMAGSLVNISGALVNSRRTYTNTINFTAQSIGLTYNYFSTPLQNNKILLFLTSFFHSGSNEVTGATTYNRLAMHISYEIVTNETYKLIASLGFRNALSRLHFSMIIFDQTDVESSGLYIMVYERINLNKNGGFIPFPQEFQDNFIIALTNLTSDRTRCVIVFQWVFTTINGSYGIYMPPSTPPGIEPVVTDYGFSYLYLKTWICPNQTFFDPSTNLCTECPIVECITCLNLTVCNVCNQSGGYFLNESTGFCERCSLVGCINCSQVNSSFICLECNSSEGYQMLNDSSCQQCNNSMDFFFNTSSLLCQLCSLENCLNCSSLYSCLLCNESSSFGLSSTFQCVFCNQSLNIFLNQSSHTCDLCSLHQCLQCSSLSSCIICNEENNFFLSDNTSLCTECNLPNCSKCLNLTFCEICNSSENSYLNITTGQCEPCQLEGCVLCQSFQVCSICNSSSGYGLDHTSPNRSLCGACNVSCSCDGYSEPWDNVSLQCGSTCGDGLIRVDEECDDENLISDDGCSARCIIQDGASCSGEPSICNTSSTLKIPKIEVTKEECNKFSITVDLQNEDQISLNQISLQSNKINIIKVEKMSPTQIKVLSEYFETIESLEIRIRNTNFAIPYSQYRPLVLYSSSECDSSQSIQNLFLALAVFSYGLLFASLVSLKIIGLQLFGVIQLSYFTLCSHSQLHLYLQLLAGFKFFNGFNIHLTNQFEKTTEILKYLGLSSSFLNNCNIMYFLMCLEVVVSFVLYAVAILTRRDTLKFISMKLLKQFFMAVLLLNLFNISFSTGIFFDLSTETHSFYSVDCFLVFLSFFFVLITVICFFVTSQKGYGEFHNKFKQDLACKLYMPLQIFYRLLIGTYCGANIEDQYSTLIVLALPLAFLLYFIVNLPFAQAMMNYRACLIHVTELIILLAANYYRSMKSNTPTETRAKLHTFAIVQIVCISLCVFVSLFTLIYEITKDIRKYCKERKQKFITNTEITNQSLTVQY